MTLLNNDYNTKFHLYSMKISANVKIAVECFEIFGGKMPQMPPSWLRAGSKLSEQAGGETMRNPSSFC